jgi:hypothetical protein
MFDLADLYLRVVESFGVTFSLVGQVFKYRPWMIPLIPVAAMMVYFGVKMRREGERSLDQRRGMSRRYPR